ncbi:MAG: ankyrin repeat domain-containing protein [Chloroflexi bacterium]|jgi:ankyrin repeat protein|nr:ankyrin repeat domain-containing protein [Chloroflexota bacterium]MBV6437686.1 hypothetical protein [Anaerolineae bacterium]MDL1917486.1 ankyrin repeat domain-containing protein [Anaerolineae bacterium CFX4]OQY76903.1 MAG: hypothetical protein B6D42_16850 [Anaerolineae bacterium UTCFX5]MBW7879884.1 ankyrin repeat domain-containing protein [Anaerolineae bacterium]
MAQQNDPHRQVMIAAHFDLDGVKAGLKGHPEWLNIEYDWGPEGGLETPLGAAAHVGNRRIAEYLLGLGAPLTPTTAAMLGMTGALEAFIDTDPASVNARGAHGIPLLGHAAFSGRVAVCDFLMANGCDGAGVTLGLLNAAGRGDSGMARWMLEHGADATATNFQGKTVLELARASGSADLVALIEQHL